MNWNGAFGLTYPDMCEHWAIGGFAVTFKILSYYRCDCHGHPDEAILIDANPDDIKPGEPTSWRPPRPPIPATALFHPGQRPYPSSRLDASEIFFLVVEVRCNVVA